MTDNLFGKRVFADVIKHFEMRNHLGLSEWVQNPMAGCSCKGKVEGNDRQKKRRQSDHRGRD